MTGSSARRWPGRSPRRRPSSSPVQPPRPGCSPSGPFGAAGRGWSATRPGWAWPSPAVGGARTSTRSGSRSRGARSWATRSRRRRRFDEAIEDMRSGPLKDRLVEIGDRLDTGLEEIWNIAKRGQILADARRRLNPDQTRWEMAQLAPPGTPVAPGSTTEQTLKSLEAQLATAQRMDTVIGHTSTGCGCSTPASTRPSPGPWSSRSRRPGPPTWAVSVGSVPTSRGSSPRWRPAPGAGRGRTGPRPAHEDAGSSATTSAWRRAPGCRGSPAWPGSPRSTSRRGPALRDAYVLANNTPNIIYELILGGILTATLVPLFIAQLEHDDDEGTSAVVSVAVVASARRHPARVRRRAAPDPALRHEPRPGRRPGATSAAWASRWRCSSCRRSSSTASWRSAPRC